MKEEKIERKDESGGNVCAVCGDKATGIHYRVQSCEGCKGFWRRTIQRNMGNKYTCKVWTETCPVTPETRGRCQRCRYLACTRAGMVADLVMADKERLSRLRLVDQNREKRKMEKGEKVEQKVEQDGKMLEMLHTLYGQFLLPTVNQDPGSVNRAAYSFVEVLLFNLMGQRDVRDVVLAAHTEVAAIHLLTSRPPLELMMIPLMSELSVQVVGLGLVPSEVVLCMAMAATRPRLTWPVASRQELGMLWDLMAGMVRRSVSSMRMAAMLQLVHQVQAVTFYVGHGGPLSMFPPVSSVTSLPPAMYPPVSSVTSMPPMYPHPMQGMMTYPTHPQQPPPVQFPQQPLYPPIGPPPTASIAAPVPLYPPTLDNGIRERTSSIKSEPQFTSLDSSSLLNTPTVKSEKVLQENLFYSPPIDEYSFMDPSRHLETGTKRHRDEEPLSPSNIPPKKRKCNLYSEILQEAINSTLV